MHHVFVSYSRTDAEWVNRLVEELERRGLSTWLDQRDIPLTLPWFEEIADAIVEADLFLICDSPASRKSTSCSAEAQIAFDAAKRSLEIEVGSEERAAAARAAAVVADLPLDYRMRTELAVLARNWDRGGRERGALVPSRLRRRLKLGTLAAPPLAAHERSFLRDSRSRSRRRTAVSILVGLTIGLSVLTAMVLNAAEEKSMEQNDEQAAAYMRTHGALRKARDDPYRALAEAAVVGGSESAIGSLITQAGFAATVPDDGFSVPAAARHFATPEIRNSVVVGDGNGGFWRRTASAREVRAAAPVTDFQPFRRTVASDSLQVRRIAGSSVVEVLRNGVLWRRIAFSQPPAVLRLSPNGRELAAGSANFAEIADLRLGAVRTTVSGAVGPIRDLAWSADGRRLWAVGEEMVVSWPVREGRVLLDLADERFEAVMPGGDNSVWVVSHDGELREVAIGSGEVLSMLRVNDEINSGGGAPDGSIAALSGERGLWLVPLREGSAPRLVEIPDCTLGRVSFLDEETFYLPCLSGPVLRMSARRGEVKRRIKIGPAGAFAVKAVPAQKLLLASDTFAHLFAIPLSGKARELFFAPCGGAITRIAVSARGNVVVPTGSGSGITGCVRRGLLAGDDPFSAASWSFNPVNDAVESTLAETAAVSSDGNVFAYGYSDGTVVLHPTVNLTPQRIVTNVGGEIRDMFVAPGDRLLVATAAGVLQRIQLCADCLTNAAFAASAERLLHRGFKLGTAVLEGGKREVAR